jgi:TetR/AcrR family transcriptional regulator, transcriptional repressor for nem operon
MRYPPEHKADIHQQIVKDASRRIRREGMAGTAVSSMMRDCGLTHGGFYKHFGRKEELLVESLSAAFKEIADRLAQAGAQSKPEAAWKVIVKTYLSLEYCDQIEYGCPLPALAPELARTDKAMKSRIFEELKIYRSRMIPFMPGRRTADKESAFFSIFSTMVGAIEIARMMPEPAMRERVLVSAKKLLLRSF